VLRALQFFFEGTTLLSDDVFNGSDNGLISVQVSFDTLSDADRTAFGVYALGEQMVLRRTWQDGAVKMTGYGLRYGDFESIRALSGVDRRTAYKEFREANADLGLPEVTRVDEADEAMLQWEMEHPGECAPRDQEAGHLFGYASVGQRRLNDRFKFVFVPGLQDAAEQAVERKGTILERLLTAIADQRSEANDELVALEERLREEYAAVVENSHRPTLRVSDLLCVRRW
jgi:putative ATP-dependent endonuclease of the OLD family